jgi:hypothetical protein
MCCLEALAHSVDYVLGKYIISWDDMVLVAEQQFMTQMSIWVTDRFFGVYFLADDTFLYSYPPCFFFFF